MRAGQYEHSMEYLKRFGQTLGEHERLAYEHGYHAAQSGKYRVPPVTTDADEVSLIGAWLRGYDDAGRAEDEFVICYPNMSRDGLYRVLYAAVMVKGAITQTFTLADKRWTPIQHARCSVDLMVRIPKGTRERFAGLAGCEISDPPRVGVNSGRGELNGHQANLATAAESPCGDSGKGATCEYCDREAVDSIKQGILVCAEHLRSEV